MKRTRFTATLSRPGSNDIEKRVILSYDASSVEAHYARLGYEVLQVDLGDYRRVARTATQHPTGARPNMLAIREAIDMLGITWPVEIKVSGHKGGTMGRCKTLPTGGQVERRGDRILNADTATGWKHVISVKNWLTTSEMGETLWHELAHAMQFERDVLPLGLDGRGSMRAWNTMYRDGTTYTDKRYEVEARSFEPFNDDLSLAR